MGIGPCGEVEMLLVEWHHLFIVEHLTIGQAVGEAWQEQVARTGTGRCKAFQRRSIAEFEVLLSVWFKEVAVAALHTPLRSPHSHHFATDVLSDGSGSSGCAHSVS